ncbi:hypothetical protein SeMB42_g05038 [Synchytrium endobioticum]|uniref:Uncharacterized protein n=1 Tax=Synchytrium endobioticum TaxID=286115 RepID=A0A507CTZ2_9FUNG|nr:hypothetical protein SeLEV6574_g05965 [Synchytrium endobioticum]TPX42662.1 hypothetical protein SeMB42_g05038 [Synchytrium endobioticum]
MVPSTLDVPIFESLYEAEQKRTHLNTIRAALKRKRDEHEYDLPTDFGKKLLKRIRMLEEAGKVNEPQTLRFSLSLPAYDMIHLRPKGQDRRRALNELAAAAPFTNSKHKAQETEEEHKGSGSTCPTPAPAPVPTAAQDSVKRPRRVQQQLPRNPSSQVRKHKDCEASPSTPTPSSAKSYRKRAPSRKPKAKPTPSNIVLRKRIPQPLVTDQEDDDADDDDEQNHEHIQPSRRSLSGHQVWGATDQYNGQHNCRTADRERKRRQQDKGKDPIREPPPKSKSELRARIQRIPTRSAHVLRSPQHEAVTEKITVLQKDNEILERRCSRFVREINNLESQLQAAQELYHSTELELLDLRLRDNQVTRTAQGNLEALCQQVNHLQTQLRQGQNPDRVQLHVATKELQVEKTRILNVHVENETFTPNRVTNNAGSSQLHRQPSRSTSREDGDRIADLEDVQDQTDALDTNLQEVTTQEVGNNGFPSPEPLQERMHTPPPPIRTTGSNLCDESEDELPSSAPLQHEGGPDILSQSSDVMRLFAEHHRQETPPTVQENIKQPQMSPPPLRTSSTRMSRADTTTTATTLDHTTPPSSKLAPQLSSIRAAPGPLSCPPSSQLDQPSEDSQLNPPIHAYRLNSRTHPADSQTLDARIINERTQDLQDELDALRRTHLAARQQLDALRTKYDLVESESVQKDVTIQSLRLLNTTIAAELERKSDALHAVSCKLKSVARKHVKYQKEANALIQAFKQSCERHVKEGQEVAKVWLPESGEEEEDHA